MLRRLDHDAGWHHPLPLPTGAAIGPALRRGRETAEVPVGARAHRGGMLERWLAAWFAGILAIASVASPSLPIELTGPAALPEPLIAWDHAEGTQPETGVLSTQPDTTGILSRLLLLESALPVPPSKAPLPRPVADPPMSAPVAAMVPGGEPRGVFQRSSVGTARTPTGPPA